MRNAFYTISRNCANKRATDKLSKFGDAEVKWGVNKDVIQLE
jgi:hypothetical protein